MSEWTKFSKDNLPNASPVLITNGSYVEVSEFGIDKGEPYFYNGTGKVDNVKYWMPLPLPPKEEE